MKILFVCLGNICRSCTAEEIMRTFLVREGMDREVEVDSAGTAGYHEGELPDSRMRVHAARREYFLTHRSRPIQTDDFYTFDLILGMDENNISHLRQLAPSPEEEKKIQQMVKYCRKGSPDHVPDPYYGGNEGFERVIDILEDACQGLLDKLKSGEITEA